MRILWWLQSIPQVPLDNPSRQTLTFSKPLCLLLLYKIAGGGRTVEGERQRKTEWVAVTKSRRFRVRQWERQHKKEGPCMWVTTDCGGVVRAHEWVAVSGNSVTNYEKERWRTQQEKPSYSTLKRQWIGKLYGANTRVSDRASGSVKCPLNPHSSLVPVYNWHGIE